MTTEKIKYYCSLENPADVIKEQAGVENLWFESLTLPERCLQFALRRLYAVFVRDYWNSKHNIPFKK